MRPQSLSPPAPHWSLTASRMLWDSSSRQTIRKMYLCVCQTLLTPTTVRIHPTPHRSPKTQSPKTGPATPSSLPTLSVSSLCSGHPGLPTVSWARQPLYHPLSVFPDLAPFSNSGPAYNPPILRGLRLPPSTPASLNGLRFIPVLATA